MYKIYTKSACPWCDKAKSLLDDQKVFYAEINIDEEEEIKKVLKEKYKTVPQVFLGPDHIGGYESLVQHFKTLNRGK